MLLVSALGLLLALQPAPPVINPTRVMFQCPDHDKDTGHTLEIVSVANGKVLQTIDVGDPPMDSAGDVVIALNVQPIVFGTYVVRVKVIVTTATGYLSSAPVESPQWRRAPGDPGNVRVGKS